MHTQNRIGSLNHIQLVVLLWGVGVAVLFGLVLAHDKSSVLVGSSTETLPLSAISTSSTNSHEQPNANWQLVLFIHPECPCTRTTLKLFERLWGEIAVRPKLTIYVTSYSRMKTEWSESTNCLLAKKLVQATILEDREAVFAKEGCANASGTLQIFDSQGRQLFSGGISSNRSCDDLNASYFAVKRLVTTGLSTLPTTPVYGCAL